MAIENKDEFLNLARTRFQIINSAESHIRPAALEDLKFVYNVEEGQWPSEVRAEREKDRRPCLTSNKLRKFVAQVANRARDERLGGKVKPVDDKADPKVAEIMSGLIRYIEFSSKADEVYADAGEKAVAGGFGYFRITTEEPDYSFDQEIFLRKIENQFSVYLDPKKEFAFIREGMPIPEFKAKYPDKAPTSVDSQGEGDSDLWYDSEKVYIAEYFYKEITKIELAKCVNMTTGEINVIELSEEVTEDALAQQGYMVVQKKAKKVKKVKWAKISGFDVLEEGEWPGSEIPIIEVVGDYVNIAGKAYKRSLVRDAKDPQRAYNFWLTHMTETVALAPKAPYIVTPQEIKGFEEMWNSANQKNLPYLLYNPQGQKKPNRESPPTVPTGAGQMLQISAGDLQDTIGMFESSFGARSNERTGAAIKARADRSDFAVFHFHDNLKRAIIETMRQLIEIIPKVYDTERRVRILGEEEQEVLVDINKKIINPETGEETIINDLSIGRYDVVPGMRSFSTRREESAQAMAEVMQAAPNIAPLMLDLLFENQDWPKADEIKRRLQKYMPQLLGAKGGEPGGVEGGTEA
jgi:hypothetical protein